MLRPGSPELKAQPLGGSRELSAVAVRLASLSYGGAVQLSEGLHYCSAHNNSTGT